MEVEEPKRKALDRERKRKAKDKAMRGYARTSIAVIAPLVGVKKGKKPSVYTEHRQRRRHGPADDGY